jgi:hypothetical protein
MSGFARITVALLAVTLAACDLGRDAVGPGVPDDPRVQPQDPVDKIGTDVLDALRRGESPAVMIALDAAQPRDMAELRRDVARAQDDAMARVTEAELRVGRRYTAVPALSAVAHDETALLRLASDPSVLRIDLDLPGTGMLGTSVPFIGGDLRHARGNGGAGVVVAVLDTGADTDNPDLADALVAEACFGDNNNSIDDVGFCPGGSDRETGPGSAEDDAGHGTHVSGIVLSNGTISGAGVAPDASLVAIKVLDNCSFAGCFFAFSEIVAALDYIIANPGLGVQIINMSLGTGALFSGTCDNATAGAMAGAAAVNTLRANGVITFAAAGNDGSGTQMPLPACLSNVVSVGSVDTNDVVAGSSNSNETTDIFAPGVGISSLAVGGGTRNAGGTSMAAPHAAGCAALLIQSGDATTPDEIEARLEDSAFQVTDPTNGLSFPRIDCSPDDNQPPALTVANAVVAVDEGSGAANSGTVVDSDGDAFTLAASVGVVTDNGDGTWSWSFGTTDGPAESQVVTITGTDALDAEGSVAFQLTVNNVTPAVDAGPDASVISNEMFDFSGSFSDPGVIDFDWHWTIDWGDATQSAGSTANQAAPIAASHQFCAAGDYTISLSVRDKDNATGTDMMTLSVGYVPVGIMIKPTDSPNPVNLRSRGQLPVAVLGSAVFDPTQIDVATIMLGDEAGTDTPVAKRPNGTWFASVEDVNGDGFPDLMLLFEVPALVANGDLVPTSTSLVLRAFLGNGCTNVRGEDSVVVRP